MQGFALTSSSQRHNVAYMLHKQSLLQAVQESNLQAYTQQLSRALEPRAPGPAVVIAQALISCTTTAMQNHRNNVGGL